MDQNSSSIQNDKKNNDDNDNENQNDSEIISQPETFTPSPIPSPSPPSPSHHQHSSDGNSPPPLPPSPSPSSPLHSSGVKTTAEDESKKQQTKVTQIINSKHQENNDNNKSSASSSNRMSRSSPIHVSRPLFLNPRLDALHYYDDQKKLKRSRREINSPFEQNIRMLYIYSDIVDLRIYAHKKLELLRIIPYRNSENGVHVRFDNPEFLPLSKSYFDRITIIVNNRERDIKFDQYNYEPVFVQLLFKRCG